MIIRKLITIIILVLLSTTSVFANFNSSISEVDEYLNYQVVKEDIGRWYKSGYYKSGEKVPSYELVGNYTSKGTTDIIKYIEYKCVILLRIFGKTIDEISTKYLTEQNFFTIYPYLLSISDDVVYNIANKKYIKYDGISETPFTIDDFLDMCHIYTRPKEEVKRFIIVDKSKSSSEKIPKRDYYSSDVSDMMTKYYKTQVIGVIDPYAKLKLFKDYNDFGDRNIKFLCVDQISPEVIEYNNKSVYLSSLVWATIYTNVSMNAAAKGDLEYSLKFCGVPDSYIFSKGKANILRVANGYSNKCDTLRASYLNISPVIAKFSSLSDSVLYKGESKKFIAYKFESPKTPKVKVLKDQEEFIPQFGNTKLNDYTSIKYKNIDMYEKPIHFYYNGKEYLAKSYDDYFMYLPDYLKTTKYRVSKYSTCIKIMDSNKFRDFIGDGLISDLRHRYTAGRYPDSINSLDHDNHYCFKIESYNNSSATPEYTITTKSDSEVFRYGSKLTTPILISNSKELTKSNVRLKFTIDNKPLSIIKEVQIGNETPLDIDVSQEFSNIGESKTLTIEIDTT